jgi:hypothetical protein
MNNQTCQAASKITRQSNKSNISKNIPQNTQQLNTLTPRLVL